MSNFFDSRQQNNDFLDDKFLVFLDTETTGLNPFYDRIIEVGFLKLENGKIVEKYNSLVNPRQKLPLIIRQISGITQSEVDNSPFFEEIIEDIDKKLKGYNIIAHNALFDLGFLNSEYKRLNNEIIHPFFCSVRMSRSLYPNYRHHNLDSIIRRFGLDVKHRHRALDDAILIYNFLQKIQKRHSTKILDKVFNISKIN